MSLTTVAELRTTLGVGTLYADAVLQEVCDAADNALLPFIWNNNQFNVGHSNLLAVGTLYFEQSVEHIFYVGQDIVVSGNGSKHNGNKTITSVSGNTISYALADHPDTTPFHPVNPVGTVAAETYLDPATTPAIQEAALMVAVTIWQARQAPSGQGMSVDGYTPSPFTMSNTLIARVRGLLAPYLDPRSMVG